MSASPIAYPLARNPDEAGGAADLQTDVMRFMAILSLCLVAIFALVQSIPADQPLPLPPANPTAEPAAVSVPVPSPVATPSVPPETTPVPAPEPVDELAQQEAAAEPGDAASRPPVFEASAPAPVPASTATEARDEGFTLRFESDNALKALVARSDIGFYAVDGGSARRLDMDTGRPQFWQASLPSAMHEMDAATVPDDVVRALERSGSGTDVQWGVTLPRRLSSQLERFLESRTGGDLVISASGDMRLE